VRDFLAYELGCQGGSNFVQQKAIRDSLMTKPVPIILDEAQHGLDKKSLVIEYLRRVAEQAGCKLILVCHSSEKHRFGEHSLAHIATRISAVVEFKPASIDDTELYLRQLCNVEIDDDIIEQAHRQSGGRYRLLSSVCATLEAIAFDEKIEGVKKLSFAQTKDYMLCENTAKLLIARSIRHAANELIKTP
jgi:hypothetical protein